MKTIRFIFLILIIISCGSDDTTTVDIPQEDPTNTENKNIVTLIPPITTNSNYLATDKNHYVVRNNQTHLNKLLLFIGGSFSTPNNYNLFCDHAATIGLDVISLSYPNNVPAATLGASSNSLIFDTYRDEICFGNQVSNVVNVDILNSINTRTLNLLVYLNQEYPDQNWDQYLATTNTIAWDKVIVSGHSQGAGHACYLAKKNIVNRAVMLSGPNDYSTFFDAPANWLTVSGATSLDKHFSLLHIEDEVVSFSNQVSNLRGLGLLASTENPVAVDNLSSPYTGANSLSSNVAAISNHNATVGSNAILPPVWTYVLTYE